jgi:alginate O-acetyltransferase complex protein AlgI
MLFNSFEFLGFFCLVFVLYWFAFKDRVRIQNLLLLAASYVFYSFWDYRFLFLLIFSTLLDYYSGIKIDDLRTNKIARKTWLCISVVINLGFLAFFKYYNFFIESFADLLQLMGFEPHMSTLQIILPVGISFYTFHGLSYVFDIYYDRVKSTRNFVDYSLFVSFFPLLVAGPIERATHLLPQIQRPRKFDAESGVSGLRQILWGLFKKIVIADNCATYVNHIFDHSNELSGSTLVLGSVLFAFQIYGDFSGYSDIASGVSRLLGIELIRNFAFPYFSRDIAEFWRRWHISLSNWFKDYVYIPLGGSRLGKAGQVRNTFIIFLISGFWHGANWTFIVWGALNAVYFLPLLLLQRNRQNLEIVAKGRILPSPKELLQIITTFALVVFAWIFFRAESMPHALSYCTGIFNASLFEPFALAPYGLFALLAFFLVVEWSGREGNFALEKMPARYPRPVRWLFYNVLILFIAVYGGKAETFIYFQF